MRDFLQMFCVFFFCMGHQCDNEKAISVECSRVHVLVASRQEDIVPIISSVGHALASSFTTPYGISPHQVIFFLFFFSLFENENWTPSAGRAVPFLPSRDESIVYSSAAADFSLFSVSAGDVRQRNPLHGPISGGS